MLNVYQIIYTYCHEDHNEAPRICQQFQSSCTHKTSFNGHHTAQWGQPKLRVTPNDFGEQEKMKLKETASSYIVRLFVCNVDLPIRDHTHMSQSIWSVKGFLFYFIFQSKS